MYVLHQHLLQRLQPASKQMPFILFIFSKKKRQSQSAGLDLTLQASFISCARDVGRWMSMKERNKLISSGNDLHLVQSGCYYDLLQKTRTEIQSNSTPGFLLFWLATECFVSSQQEGLRGRESARCLSSATPTTM